MLAVYLLLSGTMRKVLVLNTTYEPLNVCSARRALILLLKDKAEMLEQSGATLRSERHSYAIPLVIRLTTYVRVPRKSPAARISRRAVFARDRHRCQYCGSPRHLTVDHVVPRSRGGPDTWDNLVTSCAPCNRKKGDRPLHVAGLRLLRTPQAPGPAAFVLLHTDHVHESWRPYLSFAS
jgi:5-methylcytosine-specific restriction endonuclease McrA